MATIGLSANDQYGDIMIDLAKTFDKYAEDYVQFGSVKNKLHSRPDLCAFLLLDKLLPNSNDGWDMVCAAEHDKIFLDINCEKLAQIATEEDILTLARCGVFYNSDTESLAMFI